MPQGRPDDVVSSRIAGDLTLLRHLAQKLAIVTDGIGVTPFRSMAKYLADRREPRGIVLLSAHSRADRILYEDVFEPAQEMLPFRTVHVLSIPESPGPTGDGECGHIDAAMIERQIPDYRDRLIYVSGPPEFVPTIVGALRSAGVRRTEIKTDDFSGL